MSANEDFRDEVRRWLQAHCPAEMRTPVTSEKDYCWGGLRWVFQSDAQRDWLQAMAARGWTAPTWPKAYGGGGLNREQAKILAVELKAIGARKALESFGISMLGPALLKFGNEEQKLRHLPPIVRGEFRWCQGYSEPNAGSDLAGLQTRCEDHGDFYRVNGQKVWASYADQADWIFCLVRTSAEGKKQEGISFLLFHMESAGVRTKPIKLISGNSPFCEVFFDNVQVPKHDLVGERNKGWTIAKYLLTHEREMIGAFFQGSGASLGRELAEKQALEATCLADPILRADVARWDIDALAFQSTLERVRDEARAGQGLGAASSILKYYGTELNKRRFELMMSAAGSAALEWEGGASEQGALPRQWLRSKANSIEGGTSEIQLNIIAKRLLGLP